MHKNSTGGAHNLTGIGKGQWSILIGPSYGFQGNMRGEAAGSQSLLLLEMVKDD